MIVSLVSQKGGASKSTLAASIAWELHAQGSKVLLVDTDPQKTIMQVGAAAADAGVSAPTIVFMGKDLWRADQLPRLAQGFDHVVIDTPGRSGDVQNAALMVSDVALVPVGQSAPELWAVSDTIEVVKKAAELKQMHGSSLRAGIVITQKMPRTVLGKALRDSLREAELPVFRAETTHRTAWKECLGAGKGVAQYAPRDPAAKELKTLVSELLSFTNSSPRKREVANGRR